jgi:uncharacterized membrane-anchored protein
MRRNEQPESAWQPESPAHEHTVLRIEDYGMLVANGLLLLAALLAMVCFQTTFIGLVFVLSIILVLGFSLLMGLFYVLRSFILPDHLGRACDVYDGMGYFGLLSFWIACGLILLWIMHRVPAELTIGVVVVAGILGVLAFPLVLFLSDP